MIRTTLAASLLVSVSAGAFAAQDVYETEQANFRIETVAEGLNIPWSIGFLPSGEMLVTERDGGADGLRIIDADGNLRAEPVTGMPQDVVVNRQGGLFDAIPHPDFAQNRLVYISYAQGTREAHRTALIRARLSDDLTALENVEELFAVNFDIATNRHHGGKILFDRDGYLWLSLGDGGDHMDEAQNPDNHIGALIRLNDDGSVPADNPFVGGGGAPEVWSYGHRNIQGLVQHPETGTIWSHEHGPRGGDEINIHLEGGLNYGWPEITYGINYDGSIITEEREREGMKQPIWYWTPSIANSGMAFYTGDAFPHWQNDVFIGALAGMHLKRMETEGDRVIGRERLLEDLEERIRDVRNGPDGFLYITTDSDEGRVLRLVPAD